MISKIKKPVSILHVFMMIVSLFTIVPISASAATYDSGDVWYQDLQVGDVITGNVEGVMGFAQCTVTLKGGTYGKSYGDYLDEVCSEDREIGESCCGLSFNDGHIEINDMGSGERFCPIVDNQIGDAIIVLATDANRITTAG